MIRNAVLAGFFLLLFVRGNAQSLEWRQLAHLEVEGLDQVSLDNRKNILYSDLQGNVFKLDAMGTVVNHYSPLMQSKLNQLEAYFTVNILLFSADLQQVVLLDIFLNPLSTFSFDQEGIGIVRAATLGNNHIFWLFDEGALSLVQYDYRRNRILQAQPLAGLLGDGKFEVLEILERHNLVFVNIKDQGVFVFDNQGNFIRKMARFFTQKMHMFKDHLYYIHSGRIHRVHIYTGEEKTYTLPDPLFKNICVGPGKVIFYSSASMHIYALPAFN